MTPASSPTLAKHRGREMRPDPLGGPRMGRYLALVAVVWAGAFLLWMVGVIG